MSADTTSMLSATVNAIASHLPLVSRDDLSVLARICDGLEKIAESPENPEALRSLAKRGAQLCGHMMMGETPFETGLNKLNECVAKIQKTPSRTGEESARSRNAGNPQSPPTSDTTEPELSSVAEDTREFLMKFAAQQRPVLEDFEAAVLKREKGDAAAFAELRRILHTWKGEFGVLDLSDYARLIHDAEEALDCDKLTTDHLLRMKDFLEERIARFSTGRTLPVSEADRTSLLPAAPEEKPDMPPPLPPAFRLPLHLHRPATRSRYLTAIPR